MFWTLERTSSAVIMWDRGESSRTIAQRLGCSRNAVIGKMRRLGVSQGNQPMRSMADPNYRYTPWTPERRKAASDAAKRRWAERRAREEAEHRERQQRPSGRLRQIRHAKKSEMDEIASRWHRLKAEVEEIDTALKLIERLNTVLRKYRIGQG